MDFDTKRRSNESAFEYKLRLIRAKDKHEIDLDWSEIANLIDADVTPDHLRKMAKGIMEYDKYLESQLQGDKTILSISDLHVPFQLDYNCLSRYRDVDVLQINGDIVDNQALSKFTKVYRNSPMAEIIDARLYLIGMIRYLHPKKVIINYGNHDIRFEKYLAKNLDNDLVSLMPRTSLDLIVNHGFRYYDKETRADIWYDPLVEVFNGEVDIEFSDNWFCQIGDAIFCHPTAFSSGILKTSEKAMLWFRNEGYEFRTLVMAHTHRSGMYTIGNTTIYEQGAFCDTDRNHYSNGKLLNSQKQGYLAIRQNADGKTVWHDLVVLN